MMSKVNHYYFFKVGVRIAESKATRNTKAICPSLSRELRRVCSKNTNRTG